MSAAVADGDALRILRLGAEGDGVAEGPAFVPFTLPGELVRADGTVLEASAARVEPACRHFGVCGGCVVQHAADPVYAGWKEGLLGDVLARLGWDAAPGLARTPPGARRRMDLAIRRQNGAVRIGLHMRRSDAVVDMQECPVLHPRLFALIAALRPVLRALEGLRREGSAVVNLLDTGPDLLLRTDGALSAGDRARLSALAGALRVPRISWARGDRGVIEPACTLGPVALGFSGVATAVPPGAFLQASAEGEAAIREAVLALLPRLRGKAPILELFAGCGTLTHALAGRARVVAYEGDPAAVRALLTARGARVEVVQRDLARQPLQPDELKRAGCVVLDPPFGGAREQVAALAASGVPIVYVSCNPAALLRDGRALLAGGYRVVGAAGVDQFLWSARVEGVVAFARG